MEAKGNGGSKWGLKGFEDGAVVVLWVEGKAHLVPGLWIGRK